MERDD